MIIVIIITTTIITIESSSEGALFITSRNESGILGGVGRGAILSGVWWIFRWWLGVPYLVILGESLGDDLGGSWGDLGWILGGSGGSWGVLEGSWRVFVLEGFRQEGCSSLNWQ